MSLDLCCVAFGLTPELHEKTGSLLFSMVTFHFHFVFCFFFFVGSGFKMGKRGGSGCLHIPKEQLSVANRASVQCLDARL